MKPTVPTRQVVTCSLPARVWGVFWKSERTMQGPVRDVGMWEGRGGRSLCHGVWWLLEPPCLSQEWPVQLARGSLVTHLYCFLEPGAYLNLLAPSPNNVTPKEWGLQFHAQSFWKIL